MGFKRRLSVVGGKGWARGALFGDFYSNNVYLF